MPAYLLWIKVLYGVQIPVVEDCESVLVDLTGNQPALELNDIGGMSDQRMPGDQLWLRIFAQCHPGFAGCH